MIAHDVLFSTFTNSIILRSIIRSGERAMVTINPQRIFGRWKSGWALDLHTISSVPLGHNEAGHMQFETIRPEIAELLYKLKYKGDDKAAAPIIEGNCSGPYHGCGWGDGAACD